MTQATPFFHYAFPVRDLKAAREFYTEVLGCAEGRSSERWIDFNLYGHQIVAHLAPNEPACVAKSLVDGHEVPARHFGLILEWGMWEALADRLRSKKISFVIEPYIRFKGEVGEQGTMFIMDPSDNALEFKSFRDMGQIFAAR